MAKGKAVTFNGSNNDDLMYDVMFLGLIVLLFIPPYLRGLFFEAEQQVFLMFAASLFLGVWVWKWVKRKPDFLSGPLDYFTLALPVVYLISAFQAANYYLAANEVVRATLCFLVYWLVSRFPRNERDLQSILHVIYYSAIVVSMAGLAATTGIINMKDGFVDNRIQSTMQYANALGGYLAAIIFIGIYFWIKTGISNAAEGAAGKKNVSKGPEARLIPRYLYTAGNFLLLLVFAGTGSQGAFLVFLMVFPVFILGMPKNNRVHVFVYFSSVCIISFFAANRFLAAVIAGNISVSWLWVFFGLAAALAAETLGYIAYRKNFLKGLSVSKKVIPVVILVLIITILVFLNAHPGLLKNPGSILKMHSAIDRMCFFLDAAKMFKDRPVLGWGGGGWEEAYRSYQSFLYNSTQTHGYFVQVAVETGVPGLAVLAGIWGSFLFYAQRLYRGGKTAASRLLVLVLTISALSLGLHAAIDFDLSLMSIALALWTAFGLMRYLAGSAGAWEKAGNDSPGNYSPLCRFLYPGMVVISAAIVVVAGSMAMADNYFKRGLLSMQNGNVSQGIQHLLTVAAFNPLDPRGHDVLSNYYLQSGEAGQAITEAKKAIELSKYDAKKYATLSRAYYWSKEYADAVYCAEKAVSLAPLIITNYENLSNICLSAGLAELSGGNKDKAGEYFEKLAVVPDLINARMAGLSETEKTQWSRGKDPLMTVTPVVSQKVGAAQYFLGRWDDAESSLQAAVPDANARGEAILFLAVIRDKQGRTRESQDLLQKVGELEPKLVKTFNEMKNLSL